MFTNALKAKADQMESNELGNGAMTVEYVIIIMVIIAIGALLFAFRESIHTFITGVGDQMNALLTSMKTDIPSN